LVIDATDDEPVVRVDDAVEALDVIVTA